MLTFVDPQDQKVYNEFAASMQTVTSLDALQENNFIIIFEMQNLEALISELGSYTYGRSHKKITELLRFQSVSIIECNNKCVYSGKLCECRHIFQTTCLPVYEYHPNIFQLTEEDFNTFMKGD